MCPFEFVSMQHAETSNNKQHKQFTTKWKIQRNSEVKLPTYRLDTVNINRKNTQNNTKNNTQTNNQTTIKGEEMKHWLHRDTTNNTDKELVSSAAHNRDPNGMLTQGLLEAQRPCYVKQHNGPRGEAHREGTTTGGSLWWVFLVRSREKQWHNVGLCMEMLYCKYHLFYICMYVYKLGILECFEIQITFFWSFLMFSAFGIEPFQTYWILKLLDFHFWV